MLFNMMPSLYNKKTVMDHKRGTSFLIRFIVTATLACAGILTQTHVAFAQAYVPVFDNQVDTDLNNFHTDFNQYVTDLFKRWDYTFGPAPTGKTDALRDLISGSDPNVVPLGGNCAKEDGFGAFAYTDGPWKAAYASSTASTPPGDLPITVPAGGSAGSPPPTSVQVNKSQSLRCILDDLVEFQKLSVSVQIHAMLKNLIADAQAKQLTSQLRSKISDGINRWGQAGNQVNNNGIISAAPVYSINSSQEGYDVTSREVEALTDQAGATLSSGNPAGSLGISTNWNLWAASNVAKNNRNSTEDPANYALSLTQSTLSDPTSGVFAAENDWDKFQFNLNDAANTQGGLATLYNISMNQANSPLGTAELLDSAARGQVERAKANVQFDALSGGNKPTFQCSGNPGDPYCLSRLGTNISPAYQNEAAITHMAAEGDKIVAEGVTPDGIGGTSAVNQSTALNTQTGLLGNDSTPMATQTTAVNDLIQEVYDTMDIGYFGNTADTQQWVTGVMLSIYDEMKFNDTAPQVVVTSGAAATPVTTY